MEVPMTEDAVDRALSNILMYGGIAALVAGLIGILMWIL
jgi:hypothetical protein